VALPPGLLRLATRPAWTGSDPLANTMGIVAVAAFAAKAEGLSVATSIATCRRTSSAARTGKRSSWPSAKRYSIAMFRSTAKPDPLQRLQERHTYWRLRFGRSAAEVADHRHWRLLRTRWQWPRCCRATDERYELATPHSITSSARARKDSGIVRPIAFAVLTLTTSSNLVA